MNSNDVENMASRIRRDADRRSLRDPYHPAVILEDALELQYLRISGDDGSLFRLRLRNLVSSTVGFEELARQTKINSKSLHRMLSKTGNPTSRNMATIICCLQQSLGLTISVTVTAPPDALAQHAPLPAPRSMLEFQ